MITQIYTDKLVPIKCSVPRRKRMKVLRRLAKAAKFLGAVICVLEFALIYIIVTGMWGGAGA